LPGLEVSRDMVACDCAVGAKKLAEFRAPALGRN